MAKIGKSNKKHYKTIQEKAAQRRRTKANKIAHLSAMLLKNPHNERAKERLSFWENQL